MVGHDFLKDTIPVGHANFYVNYARKVVDVWLNQRGPGRFHFNDVTAWSEAMEDNKQNHARTSEKDHLA